MNLRRVVVTGLGLLTPLGNDVSTTWSNLLAGKSGVRKITTFDSSGLSSRISGSVQNFEILNYITKKEARRLDLFVHYAIGAAAEACADSDIVAGKTVEAERVGVAIGSGIGGICHLASAQTQLDKEGPRRISPFFIPSTIANMAAGYVAIQHQFCGPNLCLVSACTTGAHNISEGARLIRTGDADVMVCGGSEMATSQLGVVGFCAMKALSQRNDDPEAASRPWDRDRDGFVLGDGAGILVLEEIEHAKRRGARIYAELKGAGLSGDAYHITVPNKLGCIASMKNAIRNARINLEEIGYINAHATSTKIGDLNEIEGIKRVFGSYAKNVPIGGTKSMTGHLLGAAGAIESAFTVLALYQQILPPTINLENPDEGCDCDFIRNQAREVSFSNGLTNSFGFGGTNASLVFSRIK